MIPLHLSATSRLTLQAQIVEQIHSAIVGGMLRPDAALPSSRDLAHELKVSRNTVVLAYKHLAREGYLSMRGGAGTFIANPIPESCVRFTTADIEPGTSVEHRSEVLQAAGPLHPPVLLRPGVLRMVQYGPSNLQVDFWYGGANSRNFPLREWRQLFIENLSRTSGNLSSYGPPEGILELRRAIAAHLSVNRGIPTDPDQVIITAGAQEGLNLISRLFVQPNVRIVVENPCYQGAALVFRSYGGTLVPVPVDTQGLCISAMGCADATLAYVTPSHQFPTGVTMSTARRLDLLRWAEKTGAYIIEDDYDSDFRYDGPPIAALAGLNRNSSVIYLGTFSKSIGSGLRTGFLVVPKQLIEPMRQVKSLANYGHPWIEQIVLAEFIARGGFARHLRRIRHAYGQSRAALVESLKEHFGPSEISGAEAGMHIMWTPPAHFPSANEMVELAAADGVGLYTLEGAGAYEMSPVDYPRALLLGYAALTAEEIRKGISRLALALTRAGVSRRAQPLRGIRPLNSAVTSAARR